MGKGVLTLKKLNKIYEEVKKVESPSYPQFIKVSPHVYKMIKKAQMSYPWYIRLYYKVLNKLNLI